MSYYLWQIRLPGCYKSQTLQWLTGPNLQQEKLAIRCFTSRTFEWKLFGIGHSYRQHFWHKNKTLSAWKLYIIIAWRSCQNSHFLWLCKWIKTTHRFQSVITIWATWVIEYTARIFRKENTKRPSTLTFKGNEAERKRYYRLNISIFPPCQWDIVTLLAENLHSRHNLSKVIIEPHSVNLPTTISGFGKHPPNQRQQIKQVASLIKVNITEKFSRIK